MIFEYNFDDAFINLGIVIFLWVNFLLGTYIYSKLSYKMYYSEYKKDPDFEKVPTALRWKMIFLIFFSIPLYGIPLIGAGLSVGFSVFYLISPLLDIDLFSWDQYILSLFVYGIYIIFLAKKIPMFLYSFIKDSFEFEIYFRKNSKNWGLYTEGQEIYINENEYKRMALLGKLFIHIGLVPITIMVFTQLI